MCKVSAVFYGIRQKDGERFIQVTSHTKTKVQNKTKKELKRQNKCTNPGSNSRVSRSK